MALGHNLPSAVTQSKYKETLMTKLRSQLYDHQFQIIEATYSSLGIESCFGLGKTRWSSKTSLRIRAYDYLLTRDYINSKGINYESPISIIVDRLCSEPDQSQHRQQNRQHKYWPYLDPIYATGRARSKTTLCFRP